MVIPMSEAQGPGPGTEQALAALRQAAGDNLGIVEFGEAIARRIAALRDRATANATRVAEDLKAKAADEHAGVVAAAEEAGGGVSTAVAAAKAQIAGAASSAGQLLTQRKQASHEAVARTTTTETGRLKEWIDGGTEQVRTAFTTADQKVTAAGEKEAQAGRDHAQGLAEKATALGRTEADRYRATEEDKDLGADKADAVMQVAKRFARQLRSDGDSLAKDIRDQTSKAREQVGAEATPTITSVSEVGKGSAEGIRSFLGSVDGSIDPVARQGQEQMDAVKAGALGEVDKLSTAAHTQQVALRAQGEAAIDAAAATGLTNQAKLAGQAAELVDTAGREAVEQLTPAASAPAAQRRPASVQRDAVGLRGGPTAASDSASKKADALAQLDQMGPALDKAADGQGSEMQNSLAGAASGARQGGAALASETKSNVDKVGASAGAASPQVAAAAGAQLDSAVADGSTKSAAEVNRVGGDVDSRVAQIKQSVDGGVREATGKIQAGAQDGKKHADDTHAQLPPALAHAAAAQESFFGSLGHWFSEQLADTWQAIKGMADWRFIITLAVGFGAAALVAATVALVIVSLPFSVPALAAVLIVGAAAGAAGFAAAQITGNLLDPDPNKKWYEGVGRAAILGAFVGAAGAYATFTGMGLLAGTALVMGAAGVGTIVSNLATGKKWDDHLLANILILGIFHAVVKGISERVPSLRTGERPGGEPTTPYEPHGAGARVIVVDSASRVKASDYSPRGPGVEVCELSDSQTGATYGVAEVKLDVNGSPKGGPSLTIDPTSAFDANRNPVTLKAQGFSWTAASLRAANDAFRRRYGRGPANMSGLIAWENLRIFQENFAKFRAQGMSDALAAENAARATPFGKHRISLGYGDISVEYSAMGDVTLPNGTVLKNVPQNVYIHAKPTTGGPVPTIPTHDDAKVSQ